MRPQRGKICRRCPRYVKVHEHRQNPTSETAEPHSQKIWVAAASLRKAMCCRRRLNTLMPANGRDRTQAKPATYSFIPAPPVGVERRSACVRPDLLFPLLAASLAI